MFKNYISFAVRCVCILWYIFGHSDTVCPLGQYGSNCSSQCFNCKDMQCDQVSGVCILGCKTGFQGSMCTEVNEDPAQIIAGQEKKAPSNLSVAVGVIVSIIGLTTGIVVWVLLKRPKSYKSFIDFQPTPIEEEHKIAPLVPRDSRGGDVFWEVPVNTSEIKSINSLSSDDMVYGQDLTDAFQQKDNILKQETSKSSLKRETSVVLESRASQNLEDLSDALPLEPEINEEIVEKEENDSTEKEEPVILTTPIPENRISRVLFQQSPIQDVTPISNKDNSKLPAKDDTTEERANNDEEDQEGGEDEIEESDISSGYY